MVNKCAAHGCLSGYVCKKDVGANSEELNVNISSFRFPLKKPELCAQWERFINRRDWKPSANSVLCELHFEEKYVIRGKKCNLRWNINPIPTIYSMETLRKPSSLPTPKVFRKAPKIRLYQEDQLETFLHSDLIDDFSLLNEQHSPEGFQCRKSKNHIVFYNLVFDEETQFPKILEAIKVDNELHVQLQYSGSLIPLPPWFIRGHNAKLNRLSMLHNFPSYIRNIADENSSSLLEEMKTRKNYRAKGQPPYSPSMIRFALHLRYTSAQAYKLLLQEFPLPSMSLLKKIQAGGVDAIKAIKTLRERGEISSDIVLMVDEMYLQKATQYQGGVYVGADESGNLYKGVVAFMISGLKYSIPYIVEAIPETTITGAWLATKMAENLKILGDAGFTVRAVIADNHSTNVTAFSKLLKDYGHDCDSSSLYIEHQKR